MSASGCADARSTIQASHPAWACPVAGDRNAATAAWAGHAVACSVVRRRAAIASTWAGTARNRAEPSKPAARASSKSRRPAGAGPAGRRHREESPAQPLERLRTSEPRGDRDRTGHLPDFRKAPRAAAPLSSPSRRSDASIWRARRGQRRARRGAGMRAVAAARPALRWPTALARRARLISTAAALTQANAPRSAISGTSPSSSHQHRFSHQPRAAAMTRPPPAPR